MNKRFEGDLQESIQLKKRVSDLDTQLAGIEERYVLTQLEQSLYDNTPSNTEQILNI